jgi:hypothetical protein
VVPTITQVTMAEMIGTTLARQLLTNKFKKLGFIDSDSGLRAGIQIRSSLLSVVLHD